ncbi:MAG: MaoC family dehydratase N-terminal domain-containing protein [Deltaproteobacteria bacterium]|nr:MaoC family dehydratase N-terminal domain-containing protein [Candidatus Tharpella sp.]
MALDLDAIGRGIEPFVREYSWRDVILYALAVGAGSSEMEYCYEKNLKVLPTFSLATTFDFFWRLAREANIDLAGILHGEQELIFHNTIPVEGEMVTAGQVVNYYNKGVKKGALVVGECETCTASGLPLFTSIYSLFARFDGGFGGTLLVSGERPVFPDVEPSFVVDALPSPDQHLLYRLTGDYFEVHVDSEFAKNSGFEKPIMHGACTMGYGCRALVAKLMPGEPEKMKRIACRFSRFLYPGVPIQTLIWPLASGKALWRVVDAESGVTLIDNGICEY